MKKLVLLFAVMAGLAVSSCRMSQEKRYERYLEQKNDTTFEYIEQPRDSVVDEEAEAVSAITNDDGLVAVPDIPKERDVNMSADDYETKKVMSGRE